MVEGKRYNTRSECIQREIVEAIEACLHRGHAGDHGEWVK